MRLRTYNAGTKKHWGKSFRLEWGTRVLEWGTRGLALVLTPHPSLWTWTWWHFGGDLARSTGLYVGPIGFVYSRRGRK